MATPNPALQKPAVKPSTAPQPPAAPAAQQTGPAKPDDDLSGELEGQKTLRGYIVIRQSVNDQPSYLTLGNGGMGWTWDIGTATKFPTKKMAEPLLAEKVIENGKVVSAAGAASGAGAKIVKYDPNADDED